MFALQDPDIKKPKSHHDLACESSEPIKPVSKTSKTKIKALETLERKAHQEELKAKKPEECLKYIICYIDLSIKHLFSSDTFVADLSVDSGPSYMFKEYNQPIVCWQRKVVHCFANKNTMMIETIENELQDEPDVLVVLNTDQLIPLVYAYIDDSVGITLSQWAMSIQLIYPSRFMHLVCVGLKKYYSKVKSKQQKAFKGQILQDHGDTPGTQSKSKGKSRNKKLLVSCEKIEEAFIDLHCHTGIDVVCIEKENELIALIQQFTKAVAVAPYKMMKRENITFINEKSSVKVCLINLLLFIIYDNADV